MRLNRGLIRLHPVAQLNLDFVEDLGGPVGRELDVVVAEWSDRQLARQKLAELGAGAVLLLLNSPAGSKLTGTVQRVAYLPYGESDEERNQLLHTALRALAFGIRLSDQETDASSDLSAGPTSVFGQRERQVLALLADGKANKEIAVDLGISEGTVKFHLGELFAKLGASNRAQAVRRGLEMGLVDL